jgi:hypothetical protein
MNWAAEANEAQQIKHEEAHRRDGASIRAQAPELKHGASLELA